MTDPLLSVRGLCVAYGDVPAVRSVSLDVRAGEILGVVGESGSGKSTLVHSLFRALAPPAVITAGSVMFGGEDVLELPVDDLRGLRWSEVAVVPQNALSALNPMLTVREHFADTLRAHGVGDGAQVESMATEGMALVDLDARHLDAYPHMLSGGMRQRVVIALALVLSPSLVIFDEPTTALDVVVEHEIIQRVQALQAERGFAAIFITHDVSLLLTFAERIAVMYAGRLVEVGAASDIGHGALHPYTKGLLGALPPALGESRAATAIPGVPPSATEHIVGCRFAPRCPQATDVCRASTPTRQINSAGHMVLCHEVSV